MTFLQITMLFASAFGAATILPLSSEVLVVALVLDNPKQWPLILMVASIGNTLGSSLNWWLGRQLMHFQDRRWFPVGRSSIERAQRWYGRYGVWSLLFAWTPLIGDALSLIAGTMHARFWLCWWLMFVGKTARYAVVIAVALFAGS
ncbi:DedA family protein [Gammaproteobacteria bacterium]|nr:DedA family protein [Gammaproteobacteria bacterium]